MKTIFSEYGKVIISIIVAGAMITTFVISGFFATLLSERGNEENNISYSESDKAFYELKNSELEEATTSISEF